MAKRFIALIDSYMFGTIEDCPELYKNLFMKVHATESKQIHWVIGYKYYSCRESYEVIRIMIKSILIIIQYFLSLRDKIIIL